MRSFRTLLIATSLVALPIGSIHAQTPPTASSATATAKPAETAAPSATAAPVETATAPASAPPEASAAPEATATASSGKLPPLATDDAIAGGIGLASIVIGAALIGAGAGMHGSVLSAAPKDLRGNPVCSARPGGDVVATPDLGKCADLRKQASLGTDLGNAGITMMITGGLLAGAAAAYWLLSKPAPAPGPRSAKSAPAPTLRVAPAVGTAGGGLIVIGSF